jgi:ketosteroid isomerase-like protein
MSQENVDLVVGRMPGPNVNLAQLVHDDLMWAAWETLLVTDLDSEFECVQNVFGTTSVYKGISGLRAMLLDWLAPWATYRLEVEEAVDCGERVLVLGHAFGRRRESEQEVSTEFADIWTIRDRKAVRWEVLPTRADALKAVGLEE